MRVLVITNLYPPHILGGYEILCAQVCEALRARGHVVRVLTTTHGVTTGAPTEPGVERRLRLYAPFSRPARIERHRRVWADALNFRVTTEAIARFRPNRLFVWSQLRLTLGAARAAEASGIPVSYTLNDEHLTSYLPSAPDTGLRARVASTLDRTVLRRLTIGSLRLAHVTCISRQLQQNLTSRGLPLDHATVIYQGIPLDRFPSVPPSLPPRGPLRLLYTGQLHPYKGVHTVVDAIGRVMAKRGPGAASLTVAGTGPRDYLASLERQAAGLPIAFVGRRPHTELPALYRSHHAFVFPSIWSEPFGLTFLEAMASGLPVISTGNGGHGEVLAHDDNALVFREGDSTALAAHIERLIDDPAVGRRLAVRGRELVEGQLNLDRYVSDLERFLESAA